MSATCHIVCAGPTPRGSGCAKGSGPVTHGACVTGPDPLAHPDPSSLVIAVDGGFAHCLEAGIEPDLFVGDLDSLAPELASRIGCESIELPCDKDDTDTLYACKEGLARGYTDFVLHCALGGDVGHELANMQTLAFLHEHDARGELRGDTQRVCIVTPQDGLRAFRAPQGTRVSVLAFGGDAFGVTERGLAWELEDATLSCAIPLGVSNRSRAETFEIGVCEGMLLVVIG